MEQRRRALVVINRHARKGEDDLSRLAPLLTGAGIDMTVEDASGTRAVAAIADARACGFDLVIIGGGDGSINRALPSLIGCQLPLGILPLGTGNDLARTLGIPFDLEQACRVIAEGHVRRIDLGDVNGQAYVNVASMGVSVALARQMDPKAKKALGPLAYVWSAWRALKDVRPFRATIECDGRCIEVRSVQISVGNGRHYGGGMTVDECARVDDSTLHIYSLAPRPTWRYALLAPAMRAGTHHRSDLVTTLAGRDVSIRTSRPLDINTDGEVTTRTPARFRVHPRALPVFVPVEFAETSPEEASHAAG